MQAASLKPYDAHLIPLAQLKSRVDTFQANCLPDFEYRKDPGQLSFGIIPAAAALESRLVHGIDEDRLGLDVVGLRIEVDDVWQTYVFTRWSRHQLLAHLGTRQKWFDRVSRFQEAEELTVRREQFVHHRLRRMRGEGVGVIRGLVSSKYTDIPDTDVMAALCGILPDGYVDARSSGKTDRALYVNLISPQRIYIPGTTFDAFVGVTVKNSEVGYTSLWLLPCLWFPLYCTVVGFPTLTPYRRVHRGKVDELRDSFQEALISIGAVWSDLDIKTGALATKLFATEDDAVEALSRLVTSGAGSKLLVLRCDQHYRRQQHLLHTGVTIFNSVLAVCGAELGEDALHDHSAIAGAVLLKLLQ